MRISKFVIVGCLWGSLAWGAGETEIQIRVQDYSGLSGELRAKAQDVATTILGSAGVEPLWLDCSLALGERMDSGCRISPEPADLFLRLMPPPMARAGGRQSICLGYALVPKGGLGSLAAVFTEKARMLAVSSLAHRSSVLGHAIAHEIGHLLIGNVEHSGHGLMQALWSPAQLLRATALPMQFSERNARRVRRNARERVDASKRS